MMVAQDLFDGQSESTCQPVEIDEARPHHPALDLADLLKR